MNTWLVWFGSGALAAFKEIDDEHLNEFLEGADFEKYLSRRTIKGVIWGLYVIFGGFALITVIVGDLRKIFRI